MKKIGIMGGTFNPPHLGHCLVAKEVQAACQLDEIWFVISGVPPHKQTAEIASNEDRIKMVTAMINEETSFVVNTIEIERSGVSYSIDTIRILKEQHPTYEFFFIIGGDMVSYLPKWHEIDELLNMVTFIGVGRPGYDLDTPYPVKKVDVIQIELSSSFIRQRIQEGGNITYLVTKEVESYIREQGLYGAT